MKKVSKRVKGLLIFLAAVVVAAAVAGGVHSFAASSTAIEDYLTYTVDNGEAAITYCDPSVSGDFVIPEELGGYPVTKIGDSAFFGCLDLTLIEIPSSVTSIGNSAFRDCTGLTSIEIPEGVTSIGAGAFHGCIGLTSIEIPEGVTSIGASAFYNCTGLTLIEIPASVTSIDTGAFYNCTGLTSIEIPASVTSISSWTFAGCTRLTSIKIPSSVTTISYSAFYNCTGLTLIEIPSSVTSISYSAFYNCTGLTSIEIPVGVTKIDMYAFSGCSELTSITVNEENPVYHSAGNCLIETKTKKLIVGCNTSVIPSDGSVTSIGSSAFRDCTGLTSIEIPVGVTKIDMYAFSGCSSLTSIEIPVGVTKIDRYAFSGCSSLTSIEIPSSVTSIAECVFSGCSELTSITVNEENSVYHSAGNCLIKTKMRKLIAGCKTSVIPSDRSVASIGDFAFSGCTGLTSIAIPSRVTSIGDYAFSGCTGLISIAIPSSVTSIGNSAFRDCTGLTSIEIPASVTTISDYAFYNCTGLTSIEIPSGVTTIGEYAFSGCRGLTSIAIPSRVTSIGDSAFFGCTGLTSIAIPSSVTSIGNSAFSGCTGLTSIEIPSSVISIGSYAFYGCLELTSITVNEENPVYHSAGNCLIETKTKKLIVGCNTGVIPSDGSVTSIGSSAFYGCTGLTSIDIPSSVTSIGSWAFSHCSNLIRIDIPSGVTSIGDYAFLGCTGLSEMTLPLCGKALTSYFGTSGAPASLIKVTVVGDTTIVDAAFVGCSHLASVLLPSSVTTIGDYAFVGCSGLTSIDIPSSVVSVGKEVFNGCANLEEITLPLCGNIQTILGNSLYSLKKITAAGSSIAENAFVDCFRLPSIVLSSEFTMIEKEAFSGCTGLTSIEIPASVTWIGESAFSGCTGLTSIKIPASVTAINAGVFSGCTGLTSIQLPEGLTTIGAEAFSGCRNLADIRIPDGVEQICERAFYGCSRLLKVHLPASVTSLGDAAFSDCARLKEMTVDVGNSVYFSRGNCIVQAATKTLVAGCRGSEIPVDWNVTEIGPWAFYRCVGLKSLYIPKTISFIHDGAFAGCSGLESIRVEDGNSYYFSQGNCLIAKYAKKLVAGCKNSVIPNDGSVTAIGYRAFMGCVELAEIELPYNRLSSIDVEAFAECQDLVVTIPATVETIGTGLFRDGRQCVVRTRVKSDISNYVYTYCMNSGIPVRGIDGYLVVNGQKTETAWDVCDGVLSFVGTDDIPSYTTFAEAPWATWGDRITKVVIDERISHVGAYALYGFRNLEAVVAKSGGTTFDAQAIPGSSSKFSVYSWRGSALERACKASGVRFTPLQEAPTMQEIAQESITVKAEEGMSYSLDGKTWSETGVFTGLAAGKSYCVYARTQDGLVSEAARLTLPLDDYIPGDLDGKEGIGSEDAVYLLMHVFYPEDYPVIQLCDFNGDSRVDSADAVYLLMYVFYPEDYPLHS